MFVDRYGSEDIDDILINGRGVDVNPANKVTRTSVDTPRVEFQVKAGLRYRFRVINGGLMFCPLESFGDRCRRKSGEASALQVHHSRRR